MYTNPSEISFKWRLWLKKPGTEFEALHFQQVPRWSQAPKWGWDQVRKGRYFPQAQRVRPGPKHLWPKNTNSMQCFQNECKNILDYNISKILTKRRLLFALQPEIIVQQEQLFPTHTASQAHRTGFGGMATVWALNFIILIYCYCRHLINMFHWVWTVVGYLISGHRDTFFPPSASGSKIAGLGTVASPRITLRVAKLPGLSEQGPCLFLCVCSLATPPAGNWPAASISPRSFAEMQHLRSHSRAAESESAFPCDPQLIFMHN